ncbi:L-serine ammonia-lyase, iron-sulfur-dependent, subunit alpha [Thermatribacter velox]|uniref:UPF0597 protein QBE54_08500 n=1 Tax=Thermatribacter velox TaxID=3039681 RepID=A0ABZ2Y9G8_9BACT
MLSLKEFLRREVKPALGCTEPGAVALAVARANQELPLGELKSIQVVVSDSVYKNGLAVVIPGTGGARGNALAAALGALCGKPGYGLEVLKDCTPQDVDTAKRWVELGKVRVQCDPNQHDVYIAATVKKGTDWARCVIAGDHSNIVEVVKNGETILRSENASQAADLLFQKIKELSYPELLKLVEEMDAEDIHYLMKGATMNLTIARAGLQEGCGSGPAFGRKMQQLMHEKNLEGDLGYLIKSLCYAAADARMSGVKLPVMSSAGSGNHGITAILPVVLVGEKTGKSREEIARALAVSHLSTSFVKSRLGRLSQVCGCAIAAGAGAAAGITYLLGGKLEEMQEAMQIVLANTAGMICDGAKESCSLKVGTGAFEAYLAALFALLGSKTAIPQGLLSPSIEQTVNNMAELSQEGMRDLDRVIISILEKNFHSPKLCEGNNNLQKEVEN